MPPQAGTNYQDSYVCEMKKAIKVLKIPVRGAKGEFMPEKGAAVVVSLFEGYLSVRFKYQATVNLDHNDFEKRMMFSRFTYTKPYIEAYGVEKFVLLNDEGEIISEETKIDRYQFSINGYPVIILWADDLEDLEKFIDALDEWKNGDAI